MSDEFDVILVLVLFFWGVAFGYQLIRAKLTGEIAFPLQLLIFEDRSREDDASAFQTIFFANVLGLLGSVAAAIYVLIEGTPF